MKGMDFIWSTTALIMTCGQVWPRFEQTACPDISTYLKIKKKKIPSHNQKKWSISAEKFIFFEENFF